MNNNMNNNQPANAMPANNMGNAPDVGQAPNKSVKRGHRSGFNPHPVLVPTWNRATGEPNFKPKVRNGAVCMTDPDAQGRQYVVEEPMLKLPIDKYLEWFYCEYPNGTVKVDTSFPDAKVLRETKRVTRTDGSVEETITEKTVQPTGIAKVTFFRTPEEEQAGVSLTSYSYPMEAKKEDDLGDPASLAIGIACRQALRFAGLGVDISWECAVDKLPPYFQKERVGKQVTAGTVPGGVYEDASIPTMPAPQAAAPAEVPAPASNVDANAAKNHAAELAALEAAFGGSDKDEVPEEAVKEEPAISEEEGKAETPAEETPEETAKEEPAAPDEEASEETTSTASEQHIDGQTEMFADEECNGNPECGDVVFRTTEKASDPMKALDGKTIAEVVATAPAAIKAITKPTFTKGALEDGVREAVFGFLGLELK